MRQGVAMLFEEGAGSTIPYIGFAAGAGNSLIAGAGDDNQTRPGRFPMTVTPSADLPVVH